MALPTASDNLWPKLIVRESADDGSDFSNPSADYRVLFVGEDGDLHLKDSAGTVTDFPAGGSAGGGVDWTADINESGASFANFTANSGTWASDGTIIQQTATPSAAHRRARHNTKVALGLPYVAQVDVRLPSSGQGTGTDILAGLNIGYDGAAGTAGLAVAINDGTSGQGVQIERQSLAVLRLISATINLDTWHTLRVVVNGNLTSAYLDGTFVGSATINSLAAASPDYVGLVTYNAIADFRNFKVWTLSTGLPA